MRKFHSDSWGRLHDQNGVIGDKINSNIGCAVEILNEQQRQIDDLLNRLAAYYERDCQSCKHADYCSPTNHKCGFEKIS